MHKVPPPRAVSHNSSEEDSVDDFEAGLANIPEDEWDAHPRLMRADVAVELLKLAEQERELSDSEAELERIIRKVERDTEVECAELRYACQKSPM